MTIGGEITLWDQTEGLRPGNGIPTFGHAQLGIDVTHVGAHGVDAYAKTVGNVLIADRLCQLREYLSLPVVAAIGGSWMVDRKLIAAGDWAGITERTREALAMV